MMRRAGGVVLAMAALALSATYGPGAPMRAAADTRCTSVALTGPASPVATGTPYPFTAIASGCASPEYRWWIEPPGGKWGVVQEYSRSNSITLNFGLVGTYHVEVDVLDGDFSVPYDAVANLALDVTGCSSAGISVSPGSPAPVGTTVTITGSATCPSPSGNVGYRYWVKPPSGPWQIVQDNYLGSANVSSFTWFTDGLQPGPYGLEVDVVDFTSHMPYEAVANATFILGTPCLSPTLTTNPASPGGTGAAVTMTAGSSSCPNPQYRFWVKDPGSRWSMVQDYSASNTHVWTQTGRAGTYAMEVDVRNAPETIAYDTVANSTYELKGCTAASLSPSPAAPQRRGTAITLTAGASCPGTPTYRFWARAPGGSWKIIRDYATTNTAIWTPGVAGTWALEVDVRNQGATATYESVFNATFTVS